MAAVEATCIFCMKQTLNLVPEHVFPESIGGTLTIDQVCTPCNHWLGSNVDSHLTDHWLIQVRRRKLGLAGKKGTLPRPTINGTLDAFPETAVSLGYDKSDRMQVHIPTRITKEPQTGTRTLIVADKDLHLVPDLVRKVLERAGRSSLTSEDIANAVEITKHDQPTMTLAPPVVDIHDYRRAIMKIIYELAHRWLRDTYLADPMAQVLRAAILNNEFSPEDFLSKSIKGNILLGGDLLKGYPLDRASRHFFYLARNGDDLWICGGIFDIFSAGLVVTERAATYPEVQRSAILVDAARRTYVEAPMREVLDHLVLESRKEAEPLD